MFSVTDHDKLRQIMEESPEKKDLLTRLLASHQMTISSISHEIRNPLTLIYSTLQLIESQHPEVKTFKYWSDMHQDMDYLILLLEELSAYNNSEHLKLSSIESSSYLRSLAVSFAASLVESDIEFTSDIPSTLPSFEGDFVKLREVILNLLSNAKDAVASTNNPAISLHAFMEIEYLTIQITDNGCGIPAEMLPDIFKPFITGKSNGTGLGLAISQRITQAHHGTLSAESIPDVRTVFTLRLPVQNN